jgi:hypothetical protein
MIMKQSTAGESERKEFGATICTESGRPSISAGLYVNVQSDAVFYKSQEIDFLDSITSLHITGVQT